MQESGNAITRFYNRVKSIGFTGKMDSYEKRRLGIFNSINFLGLITGIFIPLAASFGKGYVPMITWLVAASPAFISGVVLLGNYFQRHSFAMVWYFMAYPAVTALVYAGNVDVGIELLFVLYGVLSVFFLQEMRYTILTICFTTACYLAAFVLHKQYEFVLADINFTYYVINQVLCLSFIFIGLFLIKKENTDYQKEMLYANWELTNTNEEIQKQRLELAEKASALEEQTLQLAELNTVKNRLFSVVSHDLKLPIYGLRNLFKAMHDHDTPAEDIKSYVPEILKDLNYTTGLMENLLLWAKSQMQGDVINHQLVDMSDLINEVKQLLRMQAENKKIYVQARANKDIYIYADKEMINLVLRNLLSNAIKFTPENGEIWIDAGVNGEMVEVHVRDTGKGISEEDMKKLFGNNYFTTRGTANESGTGLGLVLCKEFLNKNGGDIFVESEPGKGSRFSFTLPKA
ncbi:MAG TPA: HAMP domain-containing sensor histidine kinase [Ferruginibacter sp.]|nr:hypothetical protein [Chitinophagaceae bacterium]HRI25256.1 HAMP domain-containing sensor histidine kinase [Ferruginibacter sp.]